MSVVDQRLEQGLEQELANLTPATLEYLEQLIAENAPAARRVVQNVLEEPISEETLKSLQKPLRPKPYFPPPKKDRGRGKTRITNVDLFGRMYRETNNGWVDIRTLYDDREIEGYEKSGRRSIRWRIIKGLEQNLTPNFMEKIREKFTTSLYLRHIFGFRLIHSKTGSIILLHRNPEGSKWVTKLEDAETWLNEREKERLENEVPRPDTKWKFLDYFYVEVKVVLDRKPLVGTGFLPDWLRNLAHGRAMVTLDGYADNLCLWRCIAVFRGALPHRSTKAAKTLAQSFYKLKAIPPNFAKTSLDELDKVEAHLNGGALFSSWIGIRVYEPELFPGGEF